MSSPTLSSEHKPRPIIIKKKIVRGGGHHGGAWKIAYADFVTAMMSLFIVLWLMNSNAKVKEAVAGYFRDPAGIGKLSGTDKEGKNKTVEVPDDDLEKLKDQLEKAIRKLPRFQSLKDQITINTTSEGLRIELMETAKGLFFRSGSPTPTQEGIGLLQLLAGQLGTIPDRIVIEGHTDSAPFAGTGTYSNWDLSSDRANEARRIMQAGGLHETQVISVRGFADQQLRNPANPEDPSNRRITVIVQRPVGAKAASGPSGVKAASASSGATGKKP
jgi:chemotaxis protein MotB